ncbi:hypothetical protein MNBD_GAMMA05-2382 [hydrothermal vent metagenome]|uniref:Uncharacterized protein n=1 Tax=hydrothermal vent metagenome TaxID=652676 RepID=A0A3B0WS32_9ZZZZ
MQQGIIYKLVMGCWMLSMFAFASMAVAAERSNPWALSQAPMAENWHQTDGQLDRKQLSPSPASQSKVWRFVTPEILDSLKHQQIQMQLMPGQIVLEQNRIEPAGSCPVLPKKPSIFQPQFVPGSGQMPRSSYFSGQEMIPSQMPSMVPSDLHYGMNNTNPVFDSSAVSPWDKGGGVLYRGESFPNSFSGPVPSVLDGKFPGMSQQTYPWVPNEALGGLLPISAPSSVEGYQGETPTVTGNNSSGNIEKGKVDNVFNPFTFLPDDGLR